MKKNLFEMGADFSEDWESDNKDKVQVKSSATCEEVLVPSKHFLHFSTYIS